MNEHPDPLVAENARLSLLLMESEETVMHLAAKVRRLEAQAAKDKNQERPTE